MPENSQPLMEAGLLIDVLAEEVAIAQKIIALRKQMIDNCPGCPGPGVGSLNLFKSKVGQAINVLREANVAVENDAVSTMASVPR
jgi:hypothetical protein